MKKNTGAILALFCAASLPGCDDAPAPSATTLRPAELPCGECKGGVVELTLRYIGGAAAAIVIEAGDQVYDLGVVPPNGEFTIAGTKNNGKFQSNNLEVSVNGVVQAQEIHVSCSKPIGPGLVFGALQVVAAVSRNNGPVCPAPECLWCGVEDDKAKGVSYLAFRYSGVGATLSVHNGNNFGGAQLFGGSVSDGDLIELRASDIGKDKLKSSISFFDVNHNSLLGIHTSCSQPLVPGTVYPTALGELELVAGADKNGAALCPLLPQCEECGFGDHEASGLGSLEVVYGGPDAYVAFTNLANPAPLFAGNVIDGDVIVLDAAAAGDAALATFINVYTTPAWNWVGNFTADCSNPMGPGTAIAMPGFTLTVSGGETLGMAALCPYEHP